jgi:uncharacterized protein (TIGR04255 family)
VIPVVLPHIIVKDNGIFLNKKMMKTEYNKPPVVEVALTLNFKKSDKTLDWNTENGRNFVDSIPNFIKPNFVFQQGSHTVSDIKNGNAFIDAPPCIVTEINVRNKEETKTLGVGHDYLTYHKMRKATDYPHYADVAEGLFQYQQQYENFWKPQEVHSIILFYLDIIKIPEKEFELSNYFNFGMKYPVDIFGKLGRFEMRFIFPPEKDCDIAIDVQFNKVSSQNKDESRFLIFWNFFKKVCDMDNVKNEADEIHTFANECFERSFTNECKKLFEPKC